MKLFTIHGTHCIQCAYCFGKGHSFTTGLLKSPCLVLTSTTLTIPSLPGCSFVTRPKGHCKGGENESCLIRTTVPTAMLLDCLFHFSLTCKVFRYSEDHLFQKDWTI
uniref:Uncharacterized protein n=1 Tax=Cacopsylla melanoneura TaxID=428564 RepID=A0A8D9BXD2_9HEMI